MDVLGPSGTSPTSTHIKKVQLNLLNGGFVHRSLELITEYRNETQNRKHGFMNGVRKFCRYQFFCLKILFHVVFFTFSFCFLISKIEKKLGVLFNNTLGVFTIYVSHLILLQYHINMQMI